MTTFVDGRRAALARADVSALLVDEWRQASARHGWMIGRYAIMPDHAHFFCATLGAGRPLAQFVGSWKEWTSKRIRREAGIGDFRWQSGFFDHLLRNSESRSEKWEYAQQNPVRAGLVADPAEWPYQGAVDFE